MHQLVENALWNLADEKFWSNRKFTYDDLHADLVTEIAATNAERTTKGLPLLKAPSETTVWRMVTRHCDFDHLRKRLGTRVAGRMFKPLKGRLTASRILETAIMDHTWFDCHVIDDEHLVPVGRPYLTLLMDVRSRYPLAYVIGFTPPSVETALACLRAAVRPKHDLNERHPDVAPWEVFGAPQTVLVDNGWEFTGSSFQDACNDAGIAVTWAPVRTPEYKGIIERFFGTTSNRHSANTPPKSPTRGKKVARKASSPKPMADPSVQASDLTNHDVLASLNLAERAKRLRKERSHA